MKKILFITTIFALSFLLFGCGKKKATVEKILEQPAQQETNSNTQQNQEAFESPEVPLPQGENIVRLFFSLINEKKIPEAVAMMDDLAAPNDSAKQAWGVQFNVFDSAAVKSIEPSSMGDELDDQKTYKVVLDAKIKQGSAAAVIPKYGWVSGENIRWISLKKDESGMWKILGIGTGP